MNIFTDAQWTIIRKLQQCICNLTSAGAILKSDIGMGQSPFTPDGVITTFDIVHNLNIDNGNTSDPKRYWPKSFSLTTTEPITNNQLNRTITFPNANTMRLTYAFPPSEGENANYIWVIFK